MNDLLCRINVQGRSVVLRERLKANSITGENAVSIRKGACVVLGPGCLLRQDLYALRWECVGFFRDDDPCSDIREGADSGKDDQ
jgi:hypothetical protein